MLGQEITTEKGRVEQSNFNELSCCCGTPRAPPEIQVDWRMTANAVTGLGEPALPPAIPAVCNAIFFAAPASGSALLPLSKQGIRST